MNSKRRCTQCKKYKAVDSGIVAPIGFFCDSNCRYEYATKQTKTLVSKVRKIETKKKDKEFKERKAKLKSASDWNKEAQIAVNKYIRLRDKNKPCVSCGNVTEQKRGGTMEAGHYRSRGSASHLRFNLLNIWLQCARCNRYLSGNVVEYRKELINRIGLNRVEQLENDNKPRKFDIEYLKRVKQVFTKRAKYYS